MSSLPQISEAEYEIMKVIWEYAPVNTKEIVAVTHKKEGRIYIYSPVVKKEDYINMESRSFVDRFYNGAVNKMVMNFIENDMLSSEEIEELKNILNKKE